MGSRRGGRCDDAGDMTSSGHPARGFRTAPPGLLSPAHLVDAARTLTRYANAANAREKPILEAKFRERGQTASAIHLELTIS